ncbi:MAG: phosphopyruvate hydratase [Candidatus Dojkabacteria bacterium]|nr:MAG: phosphopyruvate hydratase [Candidatus Dojkabacteria bacterium]
MLIKDIIAREILNSRGLPAVEVDVITDDGFVSRGSAPSGASTGTFESIEITDGEEAFGGKGVDKAVANVVNLIKPALIGKDPTNQKEIDTIMMKLDGTPNEARLGGNAVLAVSIAACKAGAHVKNVPVYQHVHEIFDKAAATYTIPVPMFNVINGGAHADNNIAIQEFMVVPKGIATYDLQLRAGAEIYQILKKLIKSKGLSTGVGDEGGFAPSLTSDVEAIKLILQACEEAGYQPGKDVFIALDIAIDQYAIKSESGTFSYVFPHQGDDGTLTLRDQIEIISYYEELVRRFPITSIEDGLGEEDWNFWPTLTSKLQALNVLSIGDDFTVTNPNRLAKAVSMNALTGIIIKPNQVGTITEVLEVASISTLNNITKNASHRSGETEDNFIAHLAVGIDAQFLKNGATARSERVEKYNELLRIQEQLNKNS